MVGFGLVYCDINRELTIVAKEVAYPWEESPSEFVIGASNVSSSSNYKRF